MHGGMPSGCYPGMNVRDKFSEFIERLRQTAIHYRKRQKSHTKLLGYIAFALQTNLVRLRFLKQGNDQSNTNLFVKPKVIRKPFGRGLRHNGKRPKADSLDLENMGFHNYLARLIFWLASQIFTKKPIIFEGKRMHMPRSLISF